VGAMTMTCHPWLAAMKAARMLTSVFPKATSAHKRRFMGLFLHKSMMISLSAVVWSGVRACGKC